MKRLLGLDLLRCIAAIGIVLYHSLSQYEAMGGHAWVSAIFRHGCIGVDVFFVLSGFVIASTTAKGAYSHEYVLKFIMARMSRIYVPYWIALPIALVVTAVGGGLQNISVIESVFLTTTDQRLLANPPTWFLVHLIFYYLIYAFSLLFSESTRERMYIVLVVSGALSAFFNPVGVFIAQPQILEFFAGVLGLQKARPTLCSSVRADGDDYRDNRLVLRRRFD
ncbi:MAG: acyltransferase [Uliginosibacterium sp.]|nr:acyltransferase [Uliginosibacterium sp.]